MKTFKYIITCIAFILTGMPSCTDLDIAPMNVVQDKDIFGSESGVKSYLARIYGQMPIEDFRYTPRRGFNHFWIIDPFPTITGEAMCSNQNSAETESDDARRFFRDAYKLLRDVNYFIETLPQQAGSGNFSEDQVNMWTGEAYLIRGFTYFALAKRFGGVPIVNDVLKYPEQSVEELRVPRSSEQATWEQAAADLDKAYTLLPETNQRGRANKYTAAGFKSRVMLYAGSIAKYNTVSLSDNDGNRLCGIPESKAADYFQEAYDAAKLIEGKYSLYKAGWKADDKQAQYQNYTDMYFDKSSPENLFVREYQYPVSVHGYDSYCIPYQFMVQGYTSSVNPTLDFVEMFDGLPKNADGTINVYDENGKYLLFDSQMDFFANAEPRLRANVIFPGDDFKGNEVEIWRGIYTGSVDGGISRLIPEGTRDTYENSSAASVLVTSANDDQTPHTLPDGQLMNPAGRSGHFYDKRAHALTGFTVRKWLNPNMAAADVRENQSDQTWIELRYAEILLNRAEAAYELHLSGKNDADYVSDAYNCINQIRERAGADLLTDAGSLNDIDIIRTERRKELAFENQTWWDLRRWRIMDQEQNSRTYRVLHSFYAENAGKWFFDDRYDERNGYFTFDLRWYYAEIKGEYINSNPNLVQNQGY